MSLYFIRTPLFIRRFFKDYIWNIPTESKTLYLTFDDGPTPEITDFVLKTLQQYNAKATFFCVGKNIEKHPKIVTQIIAEGHALGNHTQNHNNGWKTTTNTYLKSIYTCDALLQKFTTHKLFRPPYGKIKNSQAKELIKTDYKIIMWTILSGDFDHTISKEQCFKNTIKHTKKGDIIVFHDTEKALQNMKYALPKMLAYFSDKNYVFKTL